MRGNRRFRDDGGSHRGPRDRDSRFSGFGDDSPAFIGDKFASAIQPTAMAAAPGSALTEEVTVKNYNSERGFGFVKTGTGDLFFHISVLRPSGYVGDPQPGDRLRIARGPGKDGREAVARAEAIT